MNIRARSLIRSEHGNESMQTVMIMAVGALILLGVNRLYRQVSPTIQQYVQAVVSGDSADQGRSGNQFSPGNLPSSVPTIASSESQRPSSQNGFSEEAQDAMPEFLADASNAIRDAIARELKEHLDVTLPTEVAYLEGVIDDLIKVRDTLDPLSKDRRLLEEEISAIRRLSNKDLQNMMEGIEGRLAINSSLSPILNQLSAMFSFDSMLEQDRKNQAIGKDPNTTYDDAYGAYLNTFQISVGMLTDGIINAATRGGSNPSRASQIVNKPTVQVAIGLAANRAGVAVAESAFPTFNSIAYWLHDNGYSPRPPRFPRDWSPPQVYK